MSNIHILYVHVECADDDDDDDDGRAVVQTQQAKEMCFRNPFKNMRLHDISE